jgi:hypothetical protein
MRTASAMANGKLQEKIFERSKPGILHFPRSGVLMSRWQLANSVRSLKRRRHGAFGVRSLEAARRRI